MATFRAWIAERLHALAAKFHVVDTVWTLKPVEIPFDNADMDRFRPAIITHEPQPAPVAAIVKAARRRSKASPAAKPTKPAAKKPRR